MVQYSGDESRWCYLGIWYKPVWYRFPPYIQVSIYPSIYLSNYLSMNPDDIIWGSDISQFGTDFLPISRYSSIHLDIYLYIYLSVFLSMNPDDVFWGSDISQFGTDFLPISRYLSIHLSIYPSVYLSINESRWCYLGIWY